MSSTFHIEPNEARKKIDTIFMNDERFNISSKASDTDILTWKPK